MTEIASPPPVPVDGIDPVRPTGAASGRLPLSGWAWASYEGFRTPYIMLIVIYVFSPYFATAVVGDPVRGQRMVADIGVIAGLITACTAPFLGASIDGLGRRKPGLALCTALMVPLIACLWFVTPGGVPGVVMRGAVLLGAISVLYAYSEVLHNSLLTRAASRRQVPHASGMANVLSNGVSVILLMFVLWAFALPGKVGWSFIPARPLFGLGTAAHEADRITGPLCAVVFALGCIPLFLFTPDAEKTGVNLWTGLRRGATGLVATLRGLRTSRDAAIFLGARMIYTDGMTALLTFGGVYAAGVMHWGVLEMLAYGLSLSVFSVIGGFTAAQLDTRLGPTLAIRLEIAAAVMLQMATLGMRRDRILFLWAYDPARHAPLWNGPMFRTLPELVYLILGFGTAVVVTASYASSRTLLTRVAPEGQTASFFGLYALSGTATVWLGSLLVRSATAATGTQQGGFAPIAVLLLLGLGGMMFVRQGRREP